MKIMLAEGGENITKFCERLAHEAAACGDVVLGEFNQHTLTANPGDTPEQVAAPFHNHSWRDYTGKLTEHERRRGC